MEVAEGHQRLADYPVTLDNFEGPLDLLLHLIQEQQLDITEVALAAVTDQYLAYLRAMEELDLAIASEFIVTAARLLDIKARTLLPPQKPAEEPPMSEDEDPAVELIRQLEEFRRYKAVAEFLQAKEAEEAPRFPRTPGEMEAFAADIELQGVTLADLAAVFQEVLKQAAQRGLEGIPSEIAPDTITVAERIQHVQQLLHSRRGRIVFLDLFKGTPSRVEVVVTFLAVLELLRRRHIRVLQEETLGPIYLERLPAPGGGPGS